MSQPPDDVAALLLDVNHEVGNLLASARMSTHLLAGDVGGAGSRELVVEVERIVSLVGMLVAQTRPLLSGPALAAVQPEHILDGVRRALGRRREAAPTAAAALPRIRVDADALVAMLVGFVRRAQLAREGDADATSVEIRVEDAEVVFRVPIGADDADGRKLAVRLADALVAQVDARSREAGGGLELRFPAAG